MISSVIAKLNRKAPAKQHTLEQIASHPALEVGELIDGRNLPITIESQGNIETEEITRWLMALEAVEFVDVVYVHFEDGDKHCKTERRKMRATEDPSERSNKSKDKDDSNTAAGNKETLKQETRTEPRSPVRNEI